MSRSFVRAWATVATIMAMACFSFVLPAPAAHVTLEAKAHAPTPNDDQISATLSFVDSPFSGKIFSPYLTISSLPLFSTGTSQRYALARANEALSPPSLEPLIRPG
jgi:hypothetical protein